MLLVPRMLFIFVWIMFSTTLGILVSIFRPFHPSNIKVTTNLIAYGRKILGIKILVRNAQEFDHHRPCVMVSNHQHNLDIFPGCTAFPDRTVSIGKKSIIWIPFFGLFYWITGNILIDRKNKKMAFEAMDVAAKSIKDRNISVWIMPEGTRSRGRGLLPFKKGPFITAIKAGVPVIPIAISSYVGKLNFNRWHAGTILIEVLPAVVTQGLSVQDANDLKNRVHAMMKIAIEKLDLEVAVLEKMNRKQ